MAKQRMSVKNHRLMQSQFPNLIVGSIWHRGGRQHGVFEAWVRDPREGKNLMGWWNRSKESFVGSASNISQTDAIVSFEEWVIEDEWAFRDDWHDVHGR